MDRWHFRWTLHASGSALGALLLATAPAVLQAQTTSPSAKVRTLTDTLPGRVGGVTVDRLGLIYVADFQETVWKVTPDGKATRFATGLYGASGNAIDSKGNLFQSNFSGNYISKIDRFGNQTVFADSGLAGPVGITIDQNDNLYVTNCRTNAISKVTKTGQLSTYASGTHFSCPNGITRDPEGNTYVVNFNDERMLKIAPDGSVGEFATLPGGGNGHVTFARGDLYATSFRGHRLYRVSLAGEVTLIAGTGAIGEQDGPGLEATFSWPNGIAAGPQGDRLYVNDFINRFPPTLEVLPQPLTVIRQIKLPSLTDVLTTALQSGGIEPMRSAYRAWKSDATTGSVFTEAEVNQLGYQLMGRNQLEAATELFKLNVESYPQSFNVYDSLAEAYMNAGKNDEAIKFYQKSLELNPANTNAVQMMKKIRGS
ncbi:MAG: tetratricopeptide repeat protein [Gemmatimonadales bacterium]|nr:tetratricopeptide repeat protein [Gemmatimonadales bacterium]